MELLQGLHVSIAVLVHVTDSICSHSCGSDRCNIRNLSLNGSLPEIAVVMDAALAHRRIYDQIDLPVCDHIQDIRASFV